MSRFSRFIEALRQGVIDGAARRQLITPLVPLGPLLGALLTYLVETSRRLAALHARFAAGKLPAAPRRSPMSRPAGERPIAGRRPPAIPPGPVLLEYDLGVYASELRALLDDPEMQALLAAAPQPGRLLRSLWRRLTGDPLPEMLRLPRKPRQARLKPGAEGALPGLRRVTLSDGTTAWEPIPCYPFSQPPPRTRARAAEPEAPAPASPPAARPPAWGRPAPPVEPRPSVPPWVMGLFQR
jgi:hypothetical protein